MVYMCVCMCFKWFCPHSKVERRFESVNLLRSGITYHICMRTTISAEREVSHITVMGFALRGHSSADAMCIYVRLFSYHL
jgi:hypothetical protein